MGQVLKNQISFDELKEDEQLLTITRYSLGLIIEDNFVCNTYNIASPETVHENLETIFNLSRQAEEVVVMLGLSSSGKIAGAFEVSRGALNRTIIHPREIFKRSILCNSNKIILAHNHPSGSLEVSNDDKEMTKKIIKAGEILGIDLLDHIIVSPEGFISMRREGIVF